MAKTKLDVVMWQARTQRTLDLREKESPKRREAIKLLKGELFGNPLASTKIGEYSPVDFLYAFTKVKVGGIYARDPFIFVRARTNTSLYVPFAETMQTTLNYYWRELRSKQKIKKAVLDGILIPPGWIGIGFTGSLQRKKPQQQDVFGDELKPVKTKTEGELGILDETIKDEDVFMKHISAWNMAWPDGYHDPREAPYLVEIEELPMIDILNNPLYKDSKYEVRATMTKGRIKKVRPHTMKANIPIASEDAIDDEIQTIKLYHIWDKRSHMRFTLADGYNDDTLFETEWDYLIDGFPKYPLIFNEIPQTDTDANSYPLSDVIPMLPQLRDLSIINSAILRHGKRAGTIIIAKKGQLTPEEITNIQNSGDLELILLESVSADALNTFNTPSLPNDWYKIRQLIIEDLMRISGFQQLLAQQQGIETATESENLRLGELIRRAESVDIMEDFTVDIARGLAGLIWQFLPRERISGIIGEEATEKMWPSLPDNLTDARRVIQQELQFRIDAGSTRPPKDEFVENKQKIDIISTIAAAFPGRLREEGAVLQILKAGKFKEVEQLVYTNDEQEIATAQKENELLLQGIPQLVSPNENHKLHIQVHGQASQVAGLQITKEFDEHVLQHGQFFNLSNPKAEPQRGDTKVTGQSVAPGITRGGVPDNVDLGGGVSNISRGTGANIS